MLAVVRAIERFHIYLYGLEFVVVTDCQALVHAVNKANLNPRIARWTLALQNYSFRLAHRSGNRMAHVDALSRQVCYIESLPIERELEYRQLQDARIKEIASGLEFEDNEKFDLIDGLVYRKDCDCPRFFVPDSMISNVIRIYHDEMAHCGAEKTFQVIYKTYWFPAMRKRIKEYIENCVICLISNSTTNCNEGEMQIVPVSKIPFEVIHVDHFGPLQETVEGYKHIFIVVDAFTRFTWFFGTKSTGSKEVLKRLQLLFGMFGNPKELVSDRGTAFTSNEFAEFVLARQIKHRKIAVACPWANGAAERVNRFLKSSLTKLVENPAEWKNYLSKVQYVINNTYHAVVKDTPSKLLLGYDQRSHSDKEMRSIVNELLAVDTNIDEERELSSNLAIQSTKKIRYYNKKYYDDRHKKPTPYNEGDFVLIRDAQAKPGINRKLKPKYKGPYQVIKVLNNNRYVVRDIAGFNVTPRPYNSILSSDRMKPWVKRVEKPEEVT